MAKRKRRELAAAADPPELVVVDTSEGFAGSHMLKNYLHLHPIWKNIQADKGKNCCDLVSSLSEVPRGHRSKGRVGKENSTVVEDAEGHEVRIVEESKSQCQFATCPRKPRNRRSKRKEESSDSEVICSPNYGRQSRRLHGRSTDSQKLGKLDSEKFEFYMENVWKRFTEEKTEVFTYFDSLWFSLYTKGPLKTKVLRWIKKKDIFSKKYVFVPIVQWGHWFLLIFCHFGESPLSKTKRPCMLLLDSLRKANSKQLEPGIRRFVFDIFKTEERSENKESIRKIPLLIPKVPQQKNGDECGFFVLYYINLFLENAPDSFSFSVGYPHFMKEDWFAAEEVQCFVETLDSMNRSSNYSG